MTTIAFKDGVLAADRQSTANGSIFGAQIKIKRVELPDGNVVLLAAAGGSTLCREFMDWVTAGMPGEPPPMFRELPGGDDHTSAGGFIFYARDRMLNYSSLGWDDMQVVDSYCDGSGGDYARGALAAGASVEEAVEIACKYDINSGCGIDVLWLPGCEPKSKLLADYGQARDLLARPPVEDRYRFEWHGIPVVGDPAIPLWKPVAGQPLLADIMNAIAAKPEIDPHGARRQP